MELYEYEKNNLKRVRKIAAECTLFLKKNGDFPLDGPCEIALYGNGARHTIKGGTGSGEVNSRFSINIEKGLTNEGFTITTGKWLDTYDQIFEKATEEFYKEIHRQALKHHTLAVMEGMGKVMPEPDYQIPLDGAGDVAVYILSRISGEGNDREDTKGDVLLTDTETHDINELNKKYKKFMLVLNTGGPVDLSSVSEVENVLVLSQLGVVTGKTFAEILTGKDFPSGKLTTTWAKWADYCTEGDFGDKHDTYYKEGIYVGYRYFDTVGKKADYAFGFGMGYTDFEVNPKSVSIYKTSVTVEAEVKNVGGFKGKEVVQVYVSVPSGRLDQPYQSLAAFAKTGVLEAGESEIVAISFDMKDVAGFDSTLPGFVLEKGSYIVRVGNSSINTKAAAVVSLAEDVVTRKVKNCLGDCGFEDYKPVAGFAADNLDGVIRLTLEASDIECEEIKYDPEYEVDEFIASLDKETLGLMNNGYFNPKGGITSVVGDASSKVAGAAGQTANPSGKKDFPVLIMADGPAGLRLCKEYTRDAEGNAHPVGLGIPESFENLMPKPVMFFLKLKANRPVKDQIHYNFATAIPIGTALAQSFNVDIAKECGDVVGDEMERFGVHLWLAPALNIHRSIRCGRNFEYFSEDPLVSGKFAAAITLGVQAHKGCGTTIKHYAANNQETNRYNNNSHVSERAMREIYLKGFEICVKESQPLALMTSYNLLNGEHTSERRDLVEDILRSEFGYEGIVMTDWVVMGGTMDKTSIHRAPDPALVAASGNDLFMPGSKGDLKKLLKGLEEGKVTRKQLEINATRVYNMAKKCNE